MSRERSEVTKCIGVQVSQLIYTFEYANIREPGFESRLLVIIIGECLNIKSIIVLTYLRMSVQFSYCIMYNSANRLLYVRYLMNTLLGMVYF